MPAGHAPDFDLLDAPSERRQRRAPPAGISVQ